MVARRVGWLFDAHGLSRASSANQRRGAPALDPQLLPQYGNRSVSLLTAPGRVGEPGIRRAGGRPDERRRIILGRPPEVHPWWRYDSLYCRPFILYPVCYCRYVGRRMHVAFTYAQRSPSARRTRCCCTAVKRPPADDAAYTKRIGTCLVRNAGSKSRAMTAAVRNDSCPLLVVRQGLAHKDDVSTPWRSHAPPPPACGMSYRGGTFTEGS